MNLLLIVVLAVLSAASTLSAQDTLWFQSYRTVDVCSNERRWLLAVNLGKVLPSDSLVSFDITIGYDRTKLRPTDVLKEGTLSAGMAYEPFLNTVVPNEMRIAGGNIIKTVYGDIPLVAVAGDFLGSCADFDSLGYPWPSTFNSEFKRKFSVVRRDSVKAIAVAKSNNKSGLRSALTTISISDTQWAEFQVSGTSLRTDSARYRFTVKSTRPGLSVVSDRGLKGLTNVSSSKIKDGIEILATVFESAPEMILRYEHGTQQRPDTAVITMSTEDLTECTCEKPTLRDTMNVLINPTVSVASSDEHIETIRMHNDALTIQCDHEEMKTVQIYSLQSELMLQTELKGFNSAVSLSNLSNGSYAVRVICGKHQHVKMILK